MPLLSTARDLASLATPLPISNDILSSHNVKLRQGQFSLLAAAPGVGKSLFASNIAVRTPIQAVYFSADSDEWTVMTRAASILTGYPLEQVDRWLCDGGSEADHIRKALTKADHVDWCFSPHLDFEFIGDRLKAHEEVWGAMPAYVVVDNLGDAVENQENEYAELKALCRELRISARMTGAHIMGLCHVMGAKENGDQPIGLGDLLGKLGKVPEVVLGLNRAGEGALNLTVPKNRGGKSGQHIKLPIDYSNAFIGGFR